MSIYILTDVCVLCGKIKLIQMCTDSITYKYIYTDIRFNHPCFIRFPSIQQDVDLLSACSSAKTKKNTQIERTKGESQRAFTHPTNRFRIELKPSDISLSLSTPSYKQIPSEYLFIHSVNNDVGISSFFFKSHSNFSAFFPPVVILSGFYLMNPWT